ncbi:hypothetical protein ASF41_13035 [Methylobacterium sp. Leaf111]|uniref:AAA family ATPase n=1 Tax=Methylobacterium sp. Leaf111 TaxID=1736257 RepID=UPI0006F35A74|nr:AAA family ATPase [Methylobacterium sp. Leaf111]KQP51108.1 hypothetical protein ASF41_13035 [Methylobacterium sp. Leaf111]
MAKQTRADDFLEFPEDDPRSATALARLEGYRPPQEVLTEAAIKAALRPADLRRLNRDGACALIVEIPGPAWAADVEIMVRDLAKFAHCFTRTGLSKTTDNPAVGNDKTSACLAFGERVLGISQAPELYLPSALLASADIRIKLNHPTNRMVARAIREATGRPPRKLPGNVSDGLDIGEISAAIRRGSTPGECVRRLVAASASKAGGQRDTGMPEAPLLSELKGYGKAHVWATALVHDLDEWRAGRLNWSEISRNCCFDSAPGLGKTSLVRSIARSAKLPLVATSVSGWFTGSNGHLDGVMKEATRVIALAAAQAPSILFLDELDALPNRATLSDHGRDWWTPIVNGILLALDSTTSGPTSRIIVIGATNHGDKLDPALVRPGRLHPVIRIFPPDAEGLAGILRQHLAEDLPDADLMGVARLGVGMSGAETVAWVADARRAARAAGRPMRMADLVERIAPSDAFTEHELHVFARHEAAHACAVEVLGAGQVREVSIGTQGSAAGMTRAKLTQGMMLTRRELDDQVVVALAGRAQDALTGSANTGAGGEHGSDLATATRLLATAHTSYGLGTRLTFVSTSANAMDMLQRSPGLQATVERDLQRLFAIAQDFVRAHRAPVQAIAELLLADRVVSGDQVRAIIARCAASQGEANAGGSHDR